MRGESVVRMIGEVVIGTVTSYPCYDRSLALGVDEGFTRGNSNTEWDRGPILLDMLTTLELSLDSS